MLIIEYPRYQINRERNLLFRVVEIKGSMKPRQPRRAEGANLSEQSNNKRIWNIESIQVRKSGPVFMPIDANPERFFQQQRKGE
jgi:hypothetical protein